MTDKLLTETDYNKILEVRLNHTDFKFLHGEMKPISENSEGFMGEHYKLKITYQHPDTSEGEEYFFLKTKPLDNKMQNTCASELRVYHREIFVYDFLLREFAKYGYDVSFAAKCYYCVPGATLVLQDITLHQYKLLERTKPYTLDQIQALLTALAKFHGAGFAYERCKAKELGRPFTLGEEYVDIMKEQLFANYLNQEKFSMDWWNTSFKALDKIIDLLSMNEDEKEKLKQLIKDAEFGKVFATETALPKTCGHGDLWSNNMMFKQPENGPVKCCLLDFQLGRYFFPAFDMLLAIFFNTTAEFRKYHLSELYQFYYDTLTQILLNYGYSIGDVLTLEEFHQSIKLIKYEALVQVFSVNIFIYIPAETLTGFVKAGSDTMQDAMFDKKTELALESFKTDERFKKTISDNIMDIYYALLSKSSAD